MCPSGLLAGIGYRGEVTYDNEAKVGACVEDAEEDALVRQYKNGKLG